MKTTAGFTLLETIVAIALCAIVVAALTSVATNSLRVGRDGNFKVQATQVLDTLGRRVAGGVDRSILPAADESVELDADELGEMVDFGDTGPWDAAFRAAITHDGTVAVGESTTVRYRIEVCHGAGSGTRCVRGTTLGRVGSAS